MSPFPGEFIGTTILIVLGDGVVANVVLNKTKGYNSSPLVIAIGWAMAVFVGVYSSATSSGAHLNPAVTIAFASLGKISWALVPAYLAGQFLGAMTGALLVWFAYRQHFAHTPDKDAKLAVFCTAPAIRSPLNNLLTEIIATFVLIMGVFYIAKPANSLGSLDALPVGLLVLGIGLCLGGPTGFAINPARDLGPRIMHFLLPIPQKRDSDWGYAWIPVAGPIIGALLAAAAYGLTPAFIKLF